MDRYNTVGLGFAEFVSQLLEETFEAVLSAQNHQSEKHLELENSLGLSNKRFIELYIDDDMLGDRETDIFDTGLSVGMMLDDNLLDTIENLFGDTKRFVTQKRLTKAGHAELRQYISNLVVAERKSLIGELVNKFEMTRCVVDSGEIRAKLELSTISQQFSITGSPSGPPGPILKGSTDSKIVTLSSVSDFMDPKDAGSVSPSVTTGSSIRTDSASPSRPIGTIGSASSTSSENALDPVEVAGVRGTQIIGPDDVASMNRADNAPGIDVAVDLAGSAGPPSPAEADGKNDVVPGRLRERGSIGPASADGIPGAPGPAGTDDKDGAPSLSGKQGPIGPSDRNGVAGPIDSGFFSTSVDIGGIRIQELVDSSTSQKVILIDKSSVGKAWPAAIPPVRTIARPVSTTSNSNLFSEVIIKFKTL